VAVLAWSLREDYLDLDRDSLPNIWETVNGLNSSNFWDRYHDNDNDGLINILEFKFGTDPFIADTDQDLMSDKYEFVNGLDGTTNDSNDDLDGDTMNNRWEYQHGLMASINDGDRDKEGDGMPNKWEYEMGLNPELTDSFLDKDNDGLPNVYEYQIGLSANNASDARGDLDGDTLTNLLEFEIGSSPLVADTDNDGMRDDFEYLNGLDPNNDDSQLDNDDDGLSNLYEYKHGLSAREKDADDDKDGDGLSNIEEFILGTNPNNVDTDNDNYSDKDEVRYGSSPLLPGSTPITHSLFIAGIFILLTLLSISTAFILPEIYHNSDIWKKKIISFLEKGDIDIPFSSDTEKIKEYTKEAKEIAKSIDKLKNNNGKDKVK